MKEEKIEKIVIDTLSKMYAAAESAFPRKFNWEDFAKYCVKSDKDQSKRELPYYAFYLNIEDYNKLMKQATRYCKYTWRWPRRTQMDKDGNIIPDPEWDEHKAKLDKMSEKLDNKDITLKEFNAFMKEEAALYNMNRRSKDAETISFSVSNYSPNSNKEYVDRLRECFEDAYNAYKNGFAYYVPDKPITQEAVEDYHKRYNEVIKQYRPEETYNIEQAQKALENNEKREKIRIAADLKEMCKFWDNYLAIENEKN